MPCLAMGNNVSSGMAGGSKHFTKPPTREYLGVLWGLNNLQPQRQTRRPILAAGFCLAAVFLMYAPFAAIAYSAHAISCCAGDHCSIREHHHQPARSAPKDDMDCGHEMSGMTACTMSCCHQDEGSGLIPIAFVLPDSSSATAPAPATPFVVTLKQIEFPRSIEPLSPPPRVTPTAL